MREQSEAFRGVRRPGVSRGLRRSLLTLVLGSLGCTTVASVEMDRGVRVARIETEVQHRAEIERGERLAREVERLRVDLQQAEEALVRAESGLRGSHSRADAVSNLAEARIQVERAAGAAPWRPAEIAEARSKLEEARRQIDQEHFGAAVFFVYRAQRIADTLEAEASRVRASSEARFVRGRRVNLRAGPATSEPVLAELSGGTPVFPEKRDRRWLLVRTPAGAVGWIYEPLVSRH